MALRQVGVAGVALRQVGAAGMALRQVGAAGMALGQVCSTGPAAFLTSDHRSCTGVLCNRPEANIAALGCGGTTCRLSNQHSVTGSPVVKVRAAGRGHECCTTVRVRVRADKPPVPSSSDHGQVEMP